MNRLPENIKYLRNKAGLTLTEFATKLDLAGKSSVHAYESGTANPQVDTIIKMAKIFSVTIDELILKKLKR